MNRIRKGGIAKMNEEKRLRISLQGFQVNPIPKFIAVMDDSCGPIKLNRVGFRAAAAIP
jgi:hypothetical protein